MEKIVEVHIMLEISQRNVCHKSHTLTGYRTQLCHAGEILSRYSYRK